MEFLRGDVDVLVSTTIIESGLDIPQANTLIVERADRLGLAQLYQIRGRVGRSRERAYAYLLYPSATPCQRGGRAPRDAVRLHRARFRVQDRDARPRDPRGGQPAGRGAVRPRRGGRLRALLQMLDEAVEAARREAAAGATCDGRGSLSGWTCPWTPTSRRITSPTRSRRSTSTGASRRRASPRTWSDRATSWRTASARFPEPVENLCGCSGRGSSSARPRRTVQFRQGRLWCIRSSSTPGRPARCTSRSRVLVRRVPEADAAGPPQRRAPGAVRGRRAGRRCPAGRKSRRRRQRPEG